MIVNIEPLLARVSKPARYTGGEWNTIVKDWDATPVRFLLAYPDVYDIGQSNLGLNILYDLLNKQSDVLCERAYAPWSDMESEMRSAGMPLWSLETRHALGDFDVLGFSLSYEMTYSNVLNMLDLADVPVLAAERTNDHPIVVAGGSGALNPEPMTLFIDAFVLGEGEEVIVEVADIVRAWKQAGTGRGGRRELLRRLAQVDGVYVPSLYDCEYNDDGTLRRFFPIEPGVPERVRRRVVNALPPPLTTPIVPFMQTVHDRAAIEIQRGCTQGCRFCQAGMIYRPTRERDREMFVETVRELLNNTGYDELSLMSLSTTDHTQIVDIVEALNQEFPHLKISIPSTRVDSFSVRVAEPAHAGRDQQACARRRHSRGGRARLQQRLDQHQDVLHGRPADRDAGRRRGHRRDRRQGEGDRAQARRQPRAGACVHLELHSKGAHAVPVVRADEPRGA
ncbi:MAG: radical SAM protein [Chloroflexi bacterium]|nr:radical SAM protein [Chloroflexota bacterium]